VIEKRKWDGTVSARWAAQLASRPPSVWSWRTVAGTIRERPRRGGLEVVAQEEFSIAGRGWWVLTAFLGADGRAERLKVDAATPVTAQPDPLLWFCDLDIDLQIDGSAVVVCDEDVLLRRAREMAYPQEVCCRARAALDDVTARYLAQRWPFDGSLAPLRPGTPPERSLTQHRFAARREGLAGGPPPWRR